MSDGVKKIDYSPVVTDPSGRQELRMLIAAAFRTARNFSVSDADVDNLVLTLDQLEQYIAARGTDSSLSRDAVEASLIGHARTRKCHVATTITDFLDLAAARFEVKLATNRVAFLEVSTDFIFLPSHAQNPVQTGSGAGMIKALPEPRFNEVILRVLT